MMVRTALTFALVPVGGSEAQALISICRADGDTHLSRVEMHTKSFISALTFGAVGLGSKAFLKFCCADVKVVGLQRLLDEVEKIRIGTSKGLITVSNHISVLDEPLMWGTLPTFHLLCAKPIRWSLGASDICFTNPVFSAFFRQGQVLETVRGAGIYQYAIDRSIELLDVGEWVHVFPEGKTAQPPHSNLQRLKWGIGRMLMETKDVPVILPMWLTGFDQVMDENRRFPRFLPRPGKRLGVTITHSEELQTQISQMLSRRESLRNPTDMDHMRSELTAAIREALVTLGTKVSGEVAEQQLKKGKEV